MKKHQLVGGIWKSDLYVRTLDQDIKDRTFKPVYLLFGEEALLKKSYKGRLREALTGGGTMNYNYFEGKRMNVNEVINLADTVSSLVEKRLVLMEDSGFLKGGVGAGELTEYVEGTPESTCLTFVESKVDKRSRLYKAVKKYGYAARLSHQEPAQLARWVVGILSKNGRRIIDRTMEFFLSRTGDDMENISSELGKLISRILGREVITDEDVEIVCTIQVTNKIFDTITTIAVRQTHKAMDLYKDFLTLKEPPMCIFFLIARQFSQILQVKNLIGKGMDRSTIAFGFKLRSFVTGKIMLQAKTLTRKQILSYVDLYVDTEKGVKTGKLQDQLAMELLIANKYE